MNAPREVCQFNRANAYKMEYTLSKYVLCAMYVQPADVIEYIVALDDLDAGFC